MYPPAPFSPLQVKFMKASVGLNLITVLITVVLIGCSGDSSPVIPADITNPSQAPEITTQNNHTGQASNSHRLYGYTAIHFDPATMDLEIIPARQVTGHWNVLTWLENGPCYNCFTIDGIVPSGPDTLTVLVRIDNPYTDLRFTGFDARGIVMFSANAEFSQSGLTWSDVSSDAAGLLNADGYTTLYNPSTEGSGPGGLQGYQDGKLATIEIPDAKLNGFVRFNSGPADNQRNEFLAGDSVLQALEIKFPDEPLVFGYAVDISWAPPSVIPVEDPVTDFPPEANCTEPWKIEIMETKIGNGLTNCDGETMLFIDVYDWQGYESHSAPVVECGDLFDTPFTSEFVSDSGDFSTWEVTLEKSHNVDPGFYTCLVSVEDNENTTSPEWLDLTGYNLITLEVVQKDFADVVAIASAEPQLTTVCTEIHFFDDGSYDPDGGEIVLYEWDWDNDGVYDDEGAEFYKFYDLPGEYLVNFRVTDDEGSTDELDEPLEITIENVMPTAVAAPVGSSWPHLAEISFDGSASYDNDCDGNAIVLWEWDWHNDGIFDDTGEFATHVFSQPGEREVQLRVTDDEGGTDILDEPLTFTIETPENPFNIEFLDSEWFHIWPTYAYAQDGRAVIYDYEYEDLIVLDITDPLAVQLINRVDFDIYYLYNGFDSSDGILYNVYDTQMTALDLTDPQAELSYWSLDSSAGAMVTVEDGYAYGYYFGQGYFGPVTIIDVDPIEETHIVSQTSIIGDVRCCEVYGNYLYVITREYYDYYQALLIYDITDKENPLFVNAMSVYNSGSANYPQIAFYGDYLYIANGRESYVVDISTPETASVVNTFSPPSYYNNASAIDIDISGNFAYVTQWWPNNYQQGTFDVFDISSPVTPVHLSQDLLDGLGIACEISGNTAVVTDWTDTSLSYPGHVTFYDITNPTSIEKVNGIGALYGEVYDFAIHENTFIGVSEYGPELHFLDITDPENLKSEGFFSLKYKSPDESSDIRILTRDGYAYIIDEGETFQVLDIDPVSDASIVGFTYTEAQAYDFDINGDYAYIAYEYGGMGIIDISDPENPALVNSFNLPDYSREIAVSNGYAFIGYEDLFVIDVDPPESAHLVATFPDMTSDRIRDIEIAGDIAYIAAERFFTLDISDPPNTHIIKVYGLITDDYRNVDVFGNYAILAGPDDDAIFDITDPAECWIVDTSTVFDDGYCDNVWIGDYLYTCYGVYRMF